MNRDDWLNAGKGAAFNVWEWGHAHPAVSSAIIGFAAGFLTKWIWF